MDERLQQRVELEAGNERRHRSGTDRSLLPAAGRPRDLGDGWPRGPSAMEASYARAAVARDVHPHRRGYRHDWRDDLCAADAGVARCQDLAAASLPLDQSLATANLRSIADAQDSRPPGPSLGPGLRSE